jgi:hypothetical protein
MFNLGHTISLTVLQLQMDVHCAEGFYNKTDIHSYPTVSLGKGNYRPTCELIVISFLGCLLHCCP